MTAARRRLSVVPENLRFVVAYIRVSSLMGRAGDDFHSPELQWGKIGQAIAGTGLTLLEEPIKDIDQTGRNFERKGIDELRRMVEAKRISAVAIYDLSRLGRDVLESLKFIAWLEGRGVVVISACEQIDTSTPAGKMMLTQLLSIAQFRSDEIGRAWAQLIDKLARSGHQHGYAATGYRKVDKRFVHDPVLGPMMTECFRRYAGGDQTMTIARYVHSVTGKAISTSNLKVRLRNPFYRGFVTHLGEVLPGAHEPLVDEETWNKVQDRMARDRTVPPRHVNPTWSMVGLLFCTCGARVQRIPHRRHDTGNVEERLLCGRSKFREAGGCNGIGMPPLAKVEAVVLAKVAAYVQELRVDPAARAASLGRKATARADVAALERELSKTRKARAKLRTAWAMDDGSDDEVYKASMNELKAAESAIAAELDSAQTVATKPDSLEVANAAEAMLTMWPEMTMTEKGKALRLVLQRIHIRKATFWREPEFDRVEIVPL